jgi:hypothetical protein
VATSTISNRHRQRESLSPRLRAVVAGALGIGLVAGGWWLLDGAYRDPSRVPILCAVAGAVGIAGALLGMRRAWRTGERHRWRERLPADLTGLVLRPPAAPASPPVPSPPGAGRGGRLP